MSYLIKYNFNVKSENGEYNKEDLKTESIQVGNLFDEVSLDILAGKVFSLLAKRNVFVTNLEIFEIVQKPVFFKENQDGFTISKKKFKFDDGAKVYGEECDQEESGTKNNKDQAKGESSSQDLQNLLANPQIINLLSTLAKTNGGIQPHQILSQPQINVPIAVGTIGEKKILRYEFYYPEDEIFVLSAKKTYPDLSFTHGKKYPIFSEKAPPDAKAGLFYETIDDKNKKVLVRSNLFTLVMPKLIGDDEPDVLTGKMVSNNKSSDGLLWGSTIESNMPEIRRR